MSQDNSKGRPDSKFKQIGSRPIRHDGLDKVTGARALWCGLRPARNA